MRKDEIKINSRMCVCKRKEGSEEERIEYIENILWKDEKVQGREIKEENDSIIKFNFDLQFYFLKNGWNFEF